MDSESNQERTADNVSVNGLDAFKLFVSRHQNQLESSGVPQHFWQALYHKLTNVVSLHFSYLLC